MSKKVDRALHGPSWTEVILGAVLSALLGAVLGALILILRPVVVAREVPGEPAAGTVYYIEGARSGSLQQALAKGKAFLDGRSVALTEQDLNALVAPASKPPVSAEKKDGESGAAEGGMFVAGTPNFRIDDSKLQVGMPVDVDVLGTKKKVIVQARGTFVKRDTFIYEPEEIYVGSCPVERLPFVSSYVRNKFIDSDALPESIRTSLAKVSDIAIEGKTLKLTMQ